MRCRVTRLTGRTNVAAYPVDGRIYSSFIVNVLLASGVLVWICCLKTRTPNGHFRRPVGRRVSTKFQYGRYESGRIFALIGLGECCQIRGSRFQGRGSWSVAFAIYAMAGGTIVYECFLARSYIRSPHRCFLLARVLRTCKTLVRCQRDPNNYHFNCIQNPRTRFGKLCLAVRMLASCFSGATSRTRIFRI
jgi:hypothetical protein